MARTAHLFTCCSVDWIDACGKERCADAEIDYDFDGADHLTITNIVCTGLNGYDDSIMEDQCWDHVASVCDEAYADDQADYGDWLYEQSLDRRNVA